MKARTRCTGVTIIEAMVALIVIGIVVTLVAPSMRSMMARSRVEGVHAEVLTDLRLARSEAAERSGTSTSVAVTFGGNADVTCYTIHISGANCDCTRGAGNACTPAVLPSPEIKTSQLTRVAGVSLSASSPSGSRIVFAPPQGLATPGDLVIDVQGTLTGHLRTSVSGLGVPSVCSPDSSIRGVAPC